MSVVELETYATELERRGYAIVRNAVDEVTLAQLREQLTLKTSDAATSRRGGSTFGVRDLLNEAPSVKDLSESSAVRTIVERIAGARARVVRGVFFDKTPDANWKVAWHQDLTITVQEKIETEGFRAWTKKAGIDHVQPPDNVLEQILTVRIHLDDATVSNGALKILPGSHKLGRLAAERIKELRMERDAVVCEARSGDCLLMRPLTLHASSASDSPQHRRVVHLEFAACELPNGLQWYEAARASVHV